jgi:hypothetical protein
VRGTLVDRCDRCNAVLRPMTQAQHAAVEAVYEDLAGQLDFPAGSGRSLGRLGLASNHCRALR